METDGAGAGVLSREQIAARIRGAPPLIEGWLDLEAQLQPNGFDLTLASVHRYVGAGTLAVENSGRSLPDLTPVAADDAGRFALEPGPYHVTFNEVVNLPTELMALGRPRSSLNRSGVSIHTAVWDAGYHGRSTSLLVVYNPAGFVIARHARLLQLVFCGLATAAAAGYAGAYQHENLSRGVEASRSPGVEENGFGL